MELQFENAVIKKIIKRSGISQKTGQAWESTDALFESAPSEQLRQSSVMRLNNRCLEDLKNRGVNLSEGQTVNVSFNLSTREYNGNFYNEVYAWHIDIVQEAMF